jgi:Transglutaminase-like superfamily
MVKRFFLFAPTAVAALLFAAVLLAENTDAPGWAVSTLARTITIGCLAASVVGGLVPKRSDVRLHASITLATFAVTALGQSQMTVPPGSVYRVGCVIFGLVVIATLRAPHRWARTAAAQRPVSTKGRARAVAVLAVAWAAVGMLFVSQLPRGARAVERRVTRYFEGHYQGADEDTVGFSSSLQLGSTRGMLKSSRVVMRIDGEHVDYLRGAVLDDYDAIHQRWSARLDELRIEHPAAAAQGGNATRIRMARSAPVAHGSEARWFLPGGACELRSESGHVTVDRGGVAHPDPPLFANEIAFRSGPSCADGQHSGALPAPQEPGPLDLALTPKLRAQLEPIAAQWTPGLTGDRAKLDAITLQLGRFGYSLEVERDRHVDAVVDLLMIHKEGHCELFATALALLARTQGIPTRVVSGYRASEINPVSGLMIVRERNAHTWVEAWVDGRWETWDPTPMSELATRSHASGWDEASEVAAWLWDRTVVTFWAIGLARVGIGAGALAIVLILIRRFMQRGAKGSADDLLVAGRPLPAFETLATALQRAGWVRSASEPLERFASRVDSGDEPWSEEVAQVLARYAELRYGGIGEERTIAERLEELARKIRPVA